MLTDEDITEAIMVSMYILPQNRLHRNTPCLIMKILVKGIFTSLTEILISSQYYLLSSLDPDSPHLCELPRI